MSRRIIRYVQPPLVSTKALFQTPIYIHSHINNFNEVMQQESNDIQDVILFIRQQKDRVNSTAQKAISSIRQINEQLNKIGINDFINRDSEYVRRFINIKDKILPTQTKSNKIKSAIESESDDSTSLELARAVADALSLTISETAMNSIANTINKKAATAITKDDIYSNTGAVLKQSGVLESLANTLSKKKELMKKRGSKQEGKSNYNKMLNEVKSLTKDLSSIFNKLGTSSQTDALEIIKSTNLLASNLKSAGYDPSTYQQNVLGNLIRQLGWLFEACVVAANYNNSKDTNGDAVIEQNINKNGISFDLYNIGIQASQLGTTSDIVLNNVLSNNPELKEQYQEIQTQIMKGTIGASLKSNLKNNLNVNVDTLLKTNRTLMGVEVGQDLLNRLMYFLFNYEVLYKDGGYAVDMQENNKSVHGVKDPGIMNLYTELMTEVDIYGKMKALLGSMYADNGESFDNILSTSENLKAIPIKLIFPNGTFNTDDVLDGIIKLTQNKDYTPNSTKRSSVFSSSELQQLHVSKLTYLRSRSDLQYNERSYEVFRDSSATRVLSILSSLTAGDGFDIAQRLLKVRASIKIDNIANKQ